MPIIDIARVQFQSTSITMYMHVVHVSTKEGLGLIGHGVDSHPDTMLRLMQSQMSGKPKLDSGYVM